MVKGANHVLNPKQASASGGRSNAYKSALLLTFVFCAYGLVCIFAEPIVARWDAATNSSNPAEVIGGEVVTGDAGEVKWGNPLYEQTEDYRKARWLVLLGLTRREAEFGRRMVASVVLGSLIGLERREANRGAGIRTMSLVSLGACIFTIGGCYAFEDGTQEWDASRVSAALPSGVGFLGGALIFKDSGTIKGLTTACGLWLSCAVGLCCGGGMYFAAAFGTSAMVAVLRFGPRNFVDTEEACVEEEEEEVCPVVEEPKAEGDKFQALSSPLLESKRLSSSPIAAATQGTGRERTASEARRRTLLVADE